MSDIVFVGSGKDYHTMDWYRSVKELCAGRAVYIATDLVESEGEERIISESDNVILLFNIDRLLLKRQSVVGNIWRNFIKLAALPLSVRKLRLLYKEKPSAIFHAHSMYYIFLCWMARIKCIATPMGSDVLVRPDHSLIYKWFTIKALRAASAITVDSVALRDKIQVLCQAKSTIIQNGIDTETIATLVASGSKRSRVTSIRAMDPNYRIYELVQARNLSSYRGNLELIYPFMEAGYKDKVGSIMADGDVNHGRITRDRMYQLFAESLLAISIPHSDSSPRTVYEAIYCGCCVAVSYGTWIDVLPDCMRARLYVVDINDNEWFDKAIEFAKQVTASPYIPSQAAIKLYDQKEAMKSVCRAFYNEKF